MSAPRGLALTTLLALVLAMVSGAFAVRAALRERSRAARHGVLTEAEAVGARALVGRLARGLIGLQRPDGGFDLGKDGEFAYFIERVASSALATAALARVRELEPDLHVDGLDAALARGLAYVRKQQTETGAVGREEPKDRWSQVDATIAGLLALATTGRPEDEPALRAAAGALRRFSRAGLRNGWTRAFGVMTVDRITALGRADLFDGKPRSLADLRDLKQARPGPPQTSDWNVAEAISRVVLGRRKGTDAFPPQLVMAVLDDPPSWGGQATDCQAIWMQAWLVARSGAPRSRAWFRALVDTVAHGGIESDDTIHGGYYANTLGQTAAAALAVIEGLTSQVVVVDGLGEASANSGNSAGR